MSPKDQDQIGKTYTEEHDRLLGYIRRRVPVSYEAEDILQDVFYQFTRAFNELDRIDNLRAWLYRVANNRIIDIFRKKKTEPVDIQPSQTNDEAETLYLDDLLPDLSDSPEDEQLKAMIRDVIDETIDDLPLEQQEVFIMHEFEEMNFQEISERTGIGINTLISRKRYAVLELRKRLEPLYNQLKFK